MATDNNDQIILRLVVKGADPAEIERLQSLTAEQIKASERLLMEQLRALHRGAQEEMLVDVSREIQQEIKLKQDQLSLLKQVTDAQLVEQRKAADAMASAQEQAALRAKYSWEQFWDEAGKAQSNKLLKGAIVNGGDAAQVSALQGLSKAELTGLEQGQIAKIAALRQQSDEAMIESTKKRVQEEIAQEQKSLQVIQQVSREKVEATKSVVRSFDRWMERLENVTTVATGAFYAMQGIAHSIKELGEGIAETTNIYGSLTGSIDKLREATLGEVSDMDLIKTKNRALEMDLKLTDEQFGMVAKAADRFADAVGVDTTEALNRLIQGLATGRLKTLEKAGAVVDAEKAQEAFAKSIGTTAEHLSDEGKRIAIVQAALQAMDKKTAEAGASTDDFGHRWEVTMARLDNIIKQVQLTLGEFFVTLIDDFTIHFPNALKIAGGALHDAFDFVTLKSVGDKIFDGKKLTSNYDAAVESVRQDYLRRRKETEAEAAKVADEAKKRLTDLANYKVPNDGNLINKKKLEETINKLRELRVAAEDFFGTLLQAESGGVEESLFGSEMTLAIEAQTKAIDDYIQRLATFDAAARKGPDAAKRVLDAMKEEVRVSAVGDESILFDAIAGPFDVKVDGAVKDVSGKVSAYESKIKNDSGVLVPWLLGDDKRLSDDVSKSLVDVDKELDSFITDRLNNRDKTLVDAVIGRAEELDGKLEPVRHRLKDEVDAYVALFAKLEHGAATADEIVGKTPNRARREPDYDTVRQQKGADDLLTQRFGKPQGLTVDEAGKQAVSEIEKEVLGSDSARTAKEIQDKMQETYAAVFKAHEQAKAELEQAAGPAGGLLGDLLFGPDGPDLITQQIQMVTSEVTAMTDMIASAAQTMSNAIGESIAAEIAGDLARRKHFRTMAHDMLESLGAQAIGRALFETASGLADLALAAFGNPTAAASAGLHFAAAAAFGAVGGAAALGARAIGQNPADFNDKGGASKNRAEFGSGGQRGDTQQQENKPINISLTVFPGGEAEAGRAVRKALRAAQNEDGLDPMGK